MPHTRSNRASPASAAPADSKPRAELRAAEQEECSYFQSCPTCPAVSVQGARSAVPRLTLAADAGGQPGLVLSAVTQIAPVLMDQMGAGALSRPVRRRPELTGEARRPFAPRPVHHRRTACCAPWRTPARRGCSARRADRHMAGAPVQSSQAPGCAAAGRQLMARSAHSGIGPPERTRLRLACSRTALRAAWPQVSNA
jgi:hypothetical protein